MKAGKPRTFGNMRKRYEQFMASGGELKNASKYANVIHLPLLKEEDSTFVISVMPPPELHLLMGGVNAVLNLLIKQYDREYIENMLRPFGIMRYKINYSVILL